MSTEERAGLRFTPQALVGVLIIIWGLILTAGNLGWVSARQVLSYWPVVLIALGYSLYSRAPDRGGRLSGGLVMFAGAWLTAGRILGWHAGFAVLWSMALVAVGVIMIVRAQERPSGGTIMDQQFSDFAFWSGVKRRVSSSTFRRADFTAVMGGVEVDLRAAGTAGGEAVIDVFVTMGGIEITVPPDWSVTNQIVAVMAGVDDKSTGVADAKNRLILRGFVIMGGVEIKT